MIVGNDISKWQGDVNFDTYKNNSNFLIIKATEGRGFTDPKFSRNQSESRRVKLPLGYYHFARPDLGNTPEAEAQYFLDIIGPLRDGEVLALDYECPNQVQAHVDWCKKWLDYVFSKVTVRAFIYLNQSQLRTFNWTAVKGANYALWVAAYTGDPNNNNYYGGVWGKAAMQQWTSSQSVPGIIGAVDGNAFFGDLPTFKKYGFKAVTPPNPEPQPDPCAAQNKQIVELTTKLDNMTKERDDLKTRLDIATRKIESAKNALN